MTTEQEVEEARKYRQKELYRKVGGVRNISILSALIGGMAIYNYVKFSKRISALKKKIHRQLIIMIQNNPQIKKLFGPNIQFNQQLRSGQVREIKQNLKQTCMGKKQKFFVCKGQTKQQNE